MPNITHKELADMMARAEKVAPLVKDFPNLKKDFAAKVSRKLEDMDPATTDGAELTDVARSMATIIANLKIEQAKVADATYDLPATMTFAEFTKKLSKAGAEQKGKDGQNHDQWKLGGKTTALGLDGHGNKTSSKNMNIYLKQLGITPAKWNKL